MRSERVSASEITTAEMDAVPTSEIAGRTVTLAEKRSWLHYSLFVLEPRARQAQRKAEGLMFNPFTFFKWRRTLREWEGITARMEAILKMRVDDGEAES